MAKEHRISKGRQVAIITEHKDGTCYTITARKLSTGRLQVSHQGGRNHKTLTAAKKYARNRIK